MSNWNSHEETERIRNHCLHMRGEFEDEMEACKNCRYRMPDIKAGALLWVCMFLDRPYTWKKEEK